MFKQQREKLIKACNPRKNCQEKTFVQLEGELTEAQLEAIAGGKLTGNHNETMVSAVELERGETHD